MEYLRPWNTRALRKHLNNVVGVENMAELEMSIDSMILDGEYRFSTIMQAIDDSIAQLDCFETSISIDTEEKLRTYLVNASFVTTRHWSGGREVL